MRLRAVLVAIVALVGLAPVGQAAAEPPPLTYQWEDPGNPQARLFTQAAVAQIGLSYCWGGGDLDGPTVGDSAVSDCYHHTTGPGFDCSGLVHYALGQAGMRLEDREASEFAKLGTIVKTPKPGDLVFYDREDDNHIEHVAIYLGRMPNDKANRQWIVEASGGKGEHAPGSLVRTRVYQPGEELFFKRMFTLQTKPRLTAETVGTGKVKLQWADLAGESGYHLSGGPNQVTINANSTSHTLSGLPADTQFCFRLRGYRGPTGEPEDTSDWSEPACAWTTVPPAAPTGLTALALTSTTVNLTWRDNAINETGYLIAGPGGPKSLPPNSTSYVWGELEAGVEYCFTVYAVNSAGATGSAEVCATTPIGAGTPSDFTAEVLADGTVHLLWRDNANDETGFQVRRRVGTVIDHASVFYYPNVEEDWIFGEPTGVELCYSVAAVRGGIATAYSNEDCVTID